MRLTEPMTLATDYALGMLALVLAWRLIGDANAGTQMAGQLWATAFGMTAVAAFVGGTCHGFVQITPARVNRLLWKAALMTTGFGSACLLGSAVVAATTGALQWVLLLIVVLKLLVYVEVVAFRDNFLLVIADYGSALVAVLLAAWLIRPSGLTAGAGWVAAGVGVSVVAGVIQARKLAPHPRFNHNDLFHVVQMVALYLLYRGGLLFVDMK